MKYIQRSFLSLLALLLFVNMSFGFAVDFNYCGGEFDSISFFGNSASCSAESSMRKNVDRAPGCLDNTHSKGDQIDSKSCCENSSFLQNEDIKNDAVDDVFTLEEIELNSADGYSFQLNLTSIDSENETFGQPPEITDCLLPEFLQVFLI